MAENRIARFLSFESRTEQSRGGSFVVFPCGPNGVPALWEQVYQAAQAQIRAAAQPPRYLTFAFSAN